MTAPQLTAEQHAFRRGAEAGERARCPFRDRDLVRAWEAGRRFGAQQRQGLRPIDTVRRKA